MLCLLVNSVSRGRGPARPESGTGIPGAAHAARQTLRDHAARRDDRLGAYGDARTDEGLGAYPRALLHHDRAVAIRQAHLPEGVIGRAHECALRGTEMRSYNDRLHVEQEPLFTDPGMVPPLELPGKLHVHPRFDVHVR